MSFLNPYSNIPFELLERSADYGEIDYATERWLEEMKSLISFEHWYCGHYHTEKKIDNLYAVGMLQEGQNLVDIEAGVIIQLDGSERPFIQKFGRTIRADSPQQFIFYYENTRDIDYLENVFEGVDEAYISTIENLENFKLNG